MAFTTIRLDVADGIAIVTLSRPERLNAFTETMMREMIAAFDATDADDAVRVVIVTGEGRAFCAGADLGAGGATFDNSRRETIEEHRDGGGQTVLRIFDSRKPVIAAVNGPAVGVGVTMTLPMDVRLAAENARFGFVFARRGICLEAASSWFLPRVVGVSQALEWTYTGRVFDAKEALAGRLVRSLHAPEALLPAARELAREIADNTSAISVAMTRQLVWKMLGADHPMEAHKIDSRAIVALGQSPDAHEGVGAFLAKRRAEFRQRPSREMPGFYPWWRERKFE
jgi:enoyl-CoA hydratase/carnithine racemase